MKSKRTTRHAKAVKKLIRKRETVLLLRTTGPAGQSHGSFVWPLKVGARVTAPDWTTEAACGHGLHGLLWGQGDGALLRWEDDSKWLVIEADRRDVVEIDGAKAKCRTCIIRYVGDRGGAVAMILAHAPADRTVVGAARAVGEYQAAAVGFRGSASAGAHGSASAGHGGSASAGAHGSASAGEKGLLIVRWYDAKADRYRATVGYADEDGIKRDFLYRCDEAGKLVEIGPRPEPKKPSGERGT